MNFHYSTKKKKLLLIDFNIMLVHWIFSLYLIRTLKILNLKLFLNSNFIIHSLENCYRFYMYIHNNQYLSIDVYYSFKNKKKRKKKNSNF